MIFSNSSRRIVGYVIVLLFLVIVSVKTYAQRGEITWGRELEGNKSEHDIFIKKDPFTKYTYWFTTENKKYYITVYDSNSVKTESKLLIFPKYKDKDVGTLPCTAVTILKDKILFIVQYYNRKT